MNRFHKLLWFIVDLIVLAILVVFMGGTTIAVVAAIVLAGFAYLIGGS